MNAEDKIIIYETPDGKTNIDVNLQNDSIWLTQEQIALLFGVQRPAITKHLKNIFESGELNEKVVSSILEHTTQHGAVKGKKQTKTIKYYNLDSIISIGYRVNSKQATQFRVWATNILKDHLIKGYTLNEKHLLEQQEKIKALTQAIHLIEATALKQPIHLDEAKALIKVIADYTYGLNILDDYDHQRLAVKDSTIKPAYVLTYSECHKFIDIMKRQFDSDLFGAEKDDSFKSSIGAIYQTFDGKEVYPSLEEKAAQLLYFVIKNHSFVDGNKRIAAAIFLNFLNKNNILYRTDGSKRLADNTLVAITLMIAESRPEDKVNIASVIVNLINQNNL